VLHHIHEQRGVCGVAVAVVATLLMPFTVAGDVRVELVLPDFRSGTLGKFAKVMEKGRKRNAAGTFKQRLIMGLIHRLSS
jgi:hypothetical protein